MIAKESLPIDVEFVDVTEQLGLSNINPRLETPSAVSLTDYDNDGKLDLYIASNGVILYRNTGEKFASDRTFISEEKHHDVVAVTDLDKDGIQDFLLQTSHVGINSLPPDG